MPLESDGVSMEVHSESGEENNSTPEYHEEEPNYGRQVLTESYEEDVSCSSAGREEENTEDYQIEYKDNEESVSFLPADREEENTEDDQIDMKTTKKVCHFHVLIEKKRTQKMTRLNSKIMKKLSCRKWKMTFKPYRLTGRMSWIVTGRYPSGVGS